MTSTKHATHTGTPSTSAADAGFAAVGRVHAEGIVELLADAFPGGDGLTSVIIGSAADGSTLLHRADVGETSGAGPVALLDAAEMLAERAAAAGGLAPHTVALVRSVFSGLRDDLARALPAPRETLGVAHDAG